MPPNILFITDDQHRYDCVEMTGRFPVHTPNLARLAREGVWQQAMISVCPLCMPARSSLHNGLYAHQHGMNVNRGHWDLGLPALPRVLQAAGYHTAAIGKLHVHEAVPEKLDLRTVRAQVMSLGYDVTCDWGHAMAAQGKLGRYRQESRARDRNGGAHPFVLADGDYQDVFIGDRCVEWLRRYEGCQPFFLWAGLVSPHPPFDAPAARLAGHARDRQPPPVDWHGDESWRDRRAHYAAMVELVDEQIGRLLGVLEERHLLDDTLVLFTSDHGEMLGDHGLWGKCYPHDPSVRVPCVARYPRRIPAGTVCGSLAELTDLPATVLDLALGCADAAALLPGTPGRSLAPVWAGRVAAVRDCAYAEDGGQFLPPFQMLRTPEWKYVFYTADRREALYDLVRDPDELHDCAPEPACAGIKAELAARLLQLVGRTPAPIR